MGYASIEDYHAQRDAADRAICDALRTAIDAGLPQAESKIWHNHPVWFLDGNPIVGYGKLKTCIRLMFWSGQSFEAAGLKPTGTFKAAEARYTDVSQVDPEALQAWLVDGAKFQWDYKNIYKTKGKLYKLVWPD